MLSFRTNGGRLGETINFLYGIFKFCKINNIPYSEIIVPLNYMNNPFVIDEKPQFVYKENIEMFQNIRYIFKDVNEDYFENFVVINLNGKSDIAQLKDFYLYNNSYKDKNILFENWWSLNKYWIIRDPKFDIKLLNYICRPEKLVKRIKKQYKKILNGKTVAIHIRRGDYGAIVSDHLLKQEYKDVKELIYGGKILYSIDDINKLIKKNIADNNVLIFSDNIEWCIENFSFYKNIYFPHGKPYEDMILMSLCDNVIVNTGSFFSLVPYILSKGFKNV